MKILIYIAGSETNSQAELYKKPQYVPSLFGRVRTHRRWIGFNANSDLNPPPLSSLTLQ